MQRKTKGMHMKLWVVAKLLFSYIYIIIFWLCDCCQDISPSLCYSIISYQACVQAQTLWENVMSFKCTFNFKWQTHTQTQNPVEKSNTDEMMKSRQNILETTRQFIIYNARYFNNICIFYLLYNFCLLFIIYIYFGAFV